MTATIIAAPKEEKPKFISPTKVEVNFNIAALMTKLKSPKVKNVNGKDNKDKMGLTNPFKMESTKLAIKAINQLLT